MMTKKGKKNKVATSESVSFVEDTNELRSLGKTVRDLSNISIISLCQSVLKQQLTKGLPTQRHTNNEPLSVQGFDQEYRQLLDLVRRTATSGESNSVLVIGPRGSGKTTVMKNVIAKLWSDEQIQENLLQVHLNGLLQTDDRIALTEITRQLKLENTLDDKVFGSFSETLQFLLEALKSGDQSSKPILFILDEFDLFTHHKNQTLLYNLFDVAQSAQAPVCVIGITCRLDVVELLEKRVKSRFSHRQIHLFNNQTFQDYVIIFKNLLTLDTQFPDQTYASQWNRHVERISRDPTVLDLLQQHFTYTKDVRALQQLLMYPVCQLCDSSPTLSVSDFVESRKLITMDSKSAMLHGVSILELCLIIAMKHMTEIYEGEPFNFEMVYSEYSKFAQRKSSMQVFEKAVVLKAFEHLIHLELVKTVDGAGSRVQKEYRLMQMLVHETQIMEALQKYPQCPTDVRQWAASSLAS
ncbi:origin recognition complex subunit 4-like isoform X2 [Ostrea edulis]|nr:origin recognition complex subunit 4-like isoform X2 [Ostrea edulis]XP_048727170.1 origin recognition complex subunit 4-like isoform X2 [Ostrea edulis]XP_048727171.1 origin recognition complex subunit 4-like isoform X2 [Ostrea edulis]XP_055996270.1 origin recognition complex subunit 4-like isoform X2 [Ostrea edulis]